jgi:alcohol dehydrogenase (cytochrome c)
VDADTGTRKWRLKSNYPILSGKTPTAGSLVFFGGVSGNFYALDATSGERLWGKRSAARLAAASLPTSLTVCRRLRWRPALHSIARPTAVVTVKIVILGL